LNEFEGAICVVFLRDLEVIVK